MYWSLNTQEIETSKSLEIFAYFFKILMRNVIVLSR